MKKLYLLFALFVALSVNVLAQSIVLMTKTGTVLPQNATLYQPSTGEDIELVTYLDVKNNASKSMSVILKKSLLQMMDSTTTTMCWADNCYPEHVFISPPKVMEGGEINPEFSGHYMWMGQKKTFTPGESHIRWVFYDEANPNDSASLMVYYTSYGAGIAGAGDPRGSIASVYPNPAKTQATVSYSIQAGHSGTLIVRDILGNAKSKVELNGSGKVTISVTDFADGIYFCTLLVDGKLSHSRKMIVKH